MARLHLAWVRSCQGCEFGGATHSRERLLLPPFHLRTQRLDAAQLLATARYSRCLACRLPRSLEDKFMPRLHWHALLVLQVSWDNLDFNPVIVIVLPVLHASQHDLLVTLKLRRWRF